MALKAHLLLQLGQRSKQDPGLGYCPRDIRYKSVIYDRIKFEVNLRLISGLGYTSLGFERCGTRDSLLVRVPMFKDSFNCMMVNTNFLFITLIQGLHS